MIAFDLDAQFSKMKEQGAAHDPQPKDCPDRCRPGYQYQYRSDQFYHTRADPSPGFHPQCGEYIDRLFRTGEFKEQRL